MNLNKLQKDAESIFQAGLKAVDPVTAVKRYLRREADKLIVNDRTYGLENYGEIYIIGAGKASARMAQPIEEILGDRLKTGIINVKYGHSVPLQTVQLNEAGHPVPDEAGLRGTQQIIQLLEQTEEKDLVFFLISGGIGTPALSVPRTDTGR